MQLVKYINIKITPITFSQQLWLDCEPKSSNELSPQSKIRQNDINQPMIHFEKETMKKNFSIASTRDDEL